MKHFQIHNEKVKYNHFNKKWKTVFNQNKYLIL